MDIAWWSYGCANDLEPSSMRGSDYKNETSETNHMINTSLDLVVQGPIGKPMRQCRFSDVIASIGMWDSCDGSQPATLEEDNAKLQALLQIKDTQISLLQKQLGPQSVGSVQRENTMPRPKAISRRRNENIVCTSGQLGGEDMAITSASPLKIGQLDCERATIAPVPILKDRIPGSAIVSVPPNCIEETMCVASERSTLPIAPIVFTTGGLEQEPLDVTRRLGPHQVNLAGHEQDKTKSELKDNAFVQTHAQNQRILGSGHNVDLQIGRVANAGIHNWQTQWPNAIASSSPALAAVSAQPRLQVPLQSFPTPLSSPYIANGQALAPLLQPAVAWQSLPLATPMASMQCFAPLNK